MSPRRIPRVAREILKEGTLCYLSAPTPQGPHVTPVVFVLEGGRLWATTSRGSVKAGAWRRDPRAAGLVRVGDAALAFRGTVVTYDALDPGTWPAALRTAFRGARAAARFTLKNSRFFAGYARDAGRVPLAWTPPGRVGVSVTLDAGAVLDTAAGEIAARWGTWGARIASRSRFRATETEHLQERRMPQEVRELGRGSGRGVVGLEGRRRQAVLPVRWVRPASDGAYFCVLPSAFLARASARADAPGTLVIDRASRWRAAHMTGLMLRGRVDAFLPRSLAAGRSALEARVGDLGPDDAVLRLRPEVAVWWQGWASGSVGRR